MNRTPLHDSHVSAGAKLVDFAGWEMPIQYTGVIDEYQAVRRAAGLFDVSHMGRILLTGVDALPFLQRVATNDAAKLDSLESHYSMVCNERGGIKDDIFVYRVKADEVLLCVNASNRLKILDWMRGQAKGWSGLELSDRTGALAQLALQGPAARKLLLDIGVSGISELKPRRCLETSLSGVDLLITRTGYTGEIGYELYIGADAAPDLWSRLLTVGAPVGVKPAGLGSRDLLRLDMAYLLYGNDIWEDRTPLEANAGWLVSFDKGDFVGRDALMQQRDSGLTRRLVSFELVDKAVPRHGFNVVDSRSPGTTIGEVTSGNLSPALQKGIGLAYVPLDYSTDGSTFSIDIRGKLMKAVVVKPPFYKRKRDG